MPSDLDDPSPYWFLVGGIKYDYCVFRIGKLNILEDEKLGKTRSHVSLVCFSSTHPKP